MIDVVKILENKIEYLERISRMHSKKIAMLEGAVDAGATPLQVDPQGTNAESKVNNNVYKL